MPWYAVFSAILHSVLYPNDYLLDLWVQLAEIFTKKSYTLSQRSIRLIAVTFRTSMPSKRTIVFTMRVPIEDGDRIVKISESRGVDRNAVLKEAVAAWYCQLNRKVK